MNQENEKVIELEVLDFSFGGNAFGRTVEGKPVFVPFVIPGEKVRVGISTEHKDYIIGELLEVLEASPKRIIPRCRHFGVCGGCHYQYLAYEHQLEIKQKIVIDQMTRIGKLQDPPVKPIIPSPSEWNYRNTMQFHISPNGKPGFRDTQGREVVEIQECHLPVEVLGDLWPNLDIDPSSGIERVVLRAGSDGELMTGLEGGQEKPPELELDFPLSLHYLGKQGDYLMSGDAYSVMTVNGVNFAVSPRSFFQVNLPQAEAMVRYVLENCDAVDKDTLLDLYCGAGLFSAFLARRVKQLVGVELSESACNDFALNLDDYDNVSLYVGKVEHVLSSLEIQPNVVLLDPPRAGLDKRVVTYLIDAKPRQVIYVSCDPSTLARDCKRLGEGGYVVESIQPFDLFPQTYHVECVALLNLKRGLSDK